jgi:hypothetical protein
MFPHNTLFVHSNSHALATRHAPTPPTTPRDLFTTFRYLRYLRYLR